MQLRLISKQLQFQFKFVKTVFGISIIMIEYRAVNFGQELKYCIM